MTPVTLGGIPVDDGQSVEAASVPSPPAASVEVVVVVSVVAWVVVTTSVTVVVSPSPPHAVTTAAANASASGYRRFRIPRRYSETDPNAIPDEAAIRTVGVDDELAEELRDRESDDSDPDGLPPAAA